MSSPLKAGTVVVELLAQDAGFHATLKKVERGVNGFGAKIRNTIMTVGLAGSAVRTAIASITGLINEFSNVGNAVAKMSRKVGIGAKDLFPSRLCCRTEREVNVVLG